MSSLLSKLVANNARSICPILVSIALLFGLTACTTRIVPGVQKSDQGELVYVFEPLFFEGKRSLQVDLLFRGAKSGVSEVFLPSVWGNQTQLDRAIKDFQVLNSQAKILAGSISNERVITHRPSEVVHLRYHLVQDWQGVPEDRERYLRPIAQSSYFHWTGGTGLVVPKWAEDKKLSVTFRWFSVPQGWLVANSFGMDETEQQFEATILELKQAVYALGSFRGKQISVPSGKVQVILRGQWPIKDEEYVAMVERVVKAQAAFFKTSSRPLRWVELLPIGLGCCYYKGVSQGDSFVAYVSSDKGLNSDLVRLVSHSLFERELLSRLPWLSQPEHRWFLHGMSQYCSRLLNLRSGQIGFSEYVQDFDQMAQEFQLSSERKSALSPWDPVRQSREIQRQFFLRADLLMAMLRAKWKGSHLAMDSAFLDFISSLAQGKAVLTPAGLGLAFASGVDRDLSEQWSAGISRGEIAINEGALGPCVQESIENTRGFDLGFDFVASKEESHIIRVRPGSPAAKAGLRNLQRFLAWKVELGNPESVAEFRVSDTRGERMISYKPQGKPKAIRRYRLDRAMLDSDAPRCVSGIVTP